MTTGDRPLSVRYDAYTARGPRASAVYASYHALRGQPGARAFKLTCGILSMKLKLSLRNKLKRESAAVNDKQLARKE